MILFCGIPTEPPLALAIAEAEEAGLDHVVFNQRHAGFCDLEVEIESGTVTGKLWTNERTLRLEAFTGVYTRLVDVSVLPESRSHLGVAPDPQRVARARAVCQALGAWLEVAPCRVLNRVRDMGSNMSKPYQAQLITRVGLATPATLVTNDPDEVAVFWERHKRIVYKSTSSVRSIVREWTPATGPTLDRVRSLPTQFQELVAGTDVRVHVVGDCVFASEIVSEAVDYRYAGRDGLAATMRPFELPAEVAERCRVVSAALQLPLAGIDLRRKSDGTYVCFEVNPSPAYSYYEESTGQPIAQAIVKYLSR